MGDNERVWRAELADMPLAFVRAYVQERDGTRATIGDPRFCQCSRCRERRADALPAGEAPLADEDEG